jgi:hypothetical protein
MRNFLVGVALLAAAACGKNTIGNGDDGNGGDGGGGGGGQDACVGLQCQVTNCAAMGMPDTAIAGRVFAPNGTLPLYDVDVYVPNADPGALSTTLACTTCNDALPGQPIGLQTTDEHGNFSLTGVPDGDNIPLVITIGKWRRQIVIPHVDKCGATPTMVPQADTTLPKSSTDASPNTRMISGAPAVDLPNIAISTGDADSLECLVRKLGIADKEITTDGQAGHIHLWSDNGAGNGKGTSAFQSGFGGGTGNLADSINLWGNATVAGKLSSYDIVILSCEGAQHDETKPQESLDHLKAYADAGGRVFLSHWHNIWIEGNTQDNGQSKPADWPSVATFNDNGDNLPNGTIDSIDTVDNPKGMSFSTWMQDPQVAGSTTPGTVAITDGTGRNTCTAVDNTKGEDWVNAPDGTSPQMLQFTTPQDQPSNSRCGKVVFSDMHVSGNSNGKAYPQECGTSNDLSPQEKALAFMFFDISSCVGSIF